MALTATEKKEIETLVRKEIKDFIGTTTVKQFEDKLLNIVIQDMKRGKTEKEIKDFRAILRKNKIASRLKVCQTSNVFCVHVYVLVHPDNREKAQDLAKEFQNETTLFYAC